MATRSVRQDTGRASRSRRTPKMSGDEREREVMDSLERLLDERPLHAISIDDIARGAGISRPTFYFYFASKEAVLLSLFERMLTEAAGRRDPSPERLAQDPAAGVREGIQAFFDVFGDHRAVTLAGADARVTSEEMRDLWAAVFEVWVAEAAEGIEAERARGAAPDGVPARDLAIALVGMNERSLYAAFGGQRPAIAEDDVVETLVAVWLNAIYGTAARPGA